MFDKNYFLSRLQAGEKIEDIGNEIAAMMNAAVQEQKEAEAKAKAEAAAKAKAAEAEKEQAKRELAEEMVDIIKELAILEGMDPDELKVTDEDMDQLVAAFTEMFAVMRDLKKMFADMETKIDAAPTPAPKAIPHAKTDEQILADFIKMFN